MSYIVVTREKPGVAVNVFCTKDGKNFKIVENPKHTELPISELIALLETHKPFKPVAVPISTAVDVLGWSIKESAEQ